MNGQSLAVDLPAVPYINHQNDEFALTDFINNSEVTNPNSIGLAAGQFQSARRNGIGFEQIKCRVDSFSISGFEGFKKFCWALLDSDGEKTQARPKSLRASLHGMESSLRSLAAS